MVHITGPAPCSMFRGRLLCMDHWPCVLQTVRTKGLVDNSSARKVVFSEYYKTVRYQELMWVRVLIPWIGTGKALYKGY